MAEYIERENAIAWFMPYAHVGESIDADVVISDIKGMKAADVAPVRHGKWIENTDGIYCWFECSECGGAAPRDIDSEIVFSAYCPNCGAKMDGGSD